MSRFGLGFVSGGGTPGNDAFTKILLHFDGANGGTTYTDVNAGGAAKTFTPTNPALVALSSTSLKFGPTSCKFSGSNLTTADHADFTVGSQDWCVDLWWNANGVSAGGFQGICGQVGAAGFTDTSLAVYRDNSDKIIAYVCIGGSPFTITGTTSINTSAWFHIAFVRTGNSIKLFINGTQEGGTVAISGSINNSTSLFGVGCTGSAGTSSNYGYMDEFRFSVGVSRWTSNFTPPASAYT